MLGLNKSLLIRLSTIAFLALSLLIQGETAPTGQLEPWAAIQAECAQRFELFKAQADPDDDRISISADNCPVLYQALTKLAHRVGVTLPTEIWLLCTAPLSLNAGASADLSNHAHPPLKPKLLIGYDFILLCTEAEFLAVMAHEFGHLKLGHLTCELGNYLLLQYRTRASLLNYLILLTKQYQSRQDELAADLVAYQTTNDPDSLYTGITKLTQAHSQADHNYQAAADWQTKWGLASHPSHEERHAALKKIHRQRRYQTQPAKKLTLATL